MEVIAVITVFILFVVVVVVKGVLIIQQAETVVVERLGQYQTTLKSGLHLIVPFFDKPRSIKWRYVRIDPEGKQIMVQEDTTRIDLRETVYDFPRQNVITKDNVITEINALLFFQITDAQKVVYEITNLPDAIEKLTQTTLRNIIGEMDLDQTLSSRDYINNKLTAILDDATDKWGVKVNRVELQDINPPEDIREAMEKQMRAERDRRAAVLVAEESKKAKILESEGKRDSDVNVAEGDKKAAILHADAEAYSRVRVAQAEAESIKRVKDAIQEAGADPSQYLIAVKYIEALKEMVSGKDNKIVYMPYEATSILGSVGSIRELFEKLPKPV